MSDIDVKNYKGVEVKLTGDASRRKREDQRFEDAVIQKVVDSNDFDVPQDMVDNEISMLVCEMNYQRQYECLTTGKLPLCDEAEKTMRMAEVRQDAYRNVKTRLVIEGIIKAENLTVTKKELEEEARAISARQQIPVEMIRDFLGEEFESLKNDLLIRKAVNMVCDSAVLI